MTKTKKAVVVIPNWNGMKFLPQCIASLKKEPEALFDILVVDNGSEDGSYEWLLSNGIPVLREEENLGFAGGVNAGLREVKTPYAILLNNDTEVYPGFIENLIRAVERHKKIFSVSARMLKVQDPERLDDAGDGMSLFGWAYQRGLGKRRETRDRAADIFSACGGAMIVRMEALEKTGAFDEMHFAYLEDIDLGWRARLHGYHNRYCPTAEVLHYGSATSGSRYNAFKVRLAARNHIWLMYKNQPDWMLWLNAPWLLAGVMIKAAFFYKKGFGREFLGGTLEGLRRRRETRRVDFSKVPAARLLALEWAMLLGTAEYVQQRLIERD